VYPSVRAKKGQQEMVGFILIVVLVMIGLMVFLVISVRDSPEVGGSLEIENMLGAIMKHTTECAIPSEPYYETFEDLFKSCYEGDECDNLKMSACDYLDESLVDVIGALMDSEATVGAYEISASVRDDKGLKGFLIISEGNCTGKTLAAQRNIVSGSESLIIRLKTCGAGGKL